MDNSIRSTWITWGISLLIQLVITVASVSFVIATYGANQKANTQVILSHTSLITANQIEISRAELKHARTNSDISNLSSKISSVELQQARDNQDIKERLELILRFLDNEK